MLEEWFRAVLFSAVTEDLLSSNLLLRYLSELQPKSSSLKPNEESMLCLFQMVDNYNVHEIEEKDPLLTNAQNSSSLLLFEGLSHMYDHKGLAEIVPMP